MYLFKNRIHEHFNINSFKDEESDKMSADGAHIQGTSGVNQQIHLYQVVTTL